MALTVSGIFFSLASPLMRMPIKRVLFSSGSDSKSSLISCRFISLAVKIKKKREKKKRKRFHYKIQKQNGLNKWDHSFDYSLKEIREDFSSKLVVKLYSHGD